MFQSCELWGGTIFDLRQKFLVNCEKKKKGKMQFIFFLICSFVFFSCSSVANKCIIVDVKHKSVAEEVSNCIFFRNITTTFLQFKEKQVYLQGKNKIHYAWVANHLLSSWSLASLLRKRLYDVFTLFCNV